jgi:hypothetical protein
MPVWIQVAADINHEAVTMVSNAVRLFVKGGKQIGRGGVVAEGSADVCESVDVSGSEDETATELEGIVSEPVLLVSSCAGSFSCLSVSRTEQMEEIGFFQSCRPVGEPVFVDQQRKTDSGLFPEGLRVVAVTKAYGSQFGVFGLEFRFVLAQLRDVLTAEDSSVVP